MPNVNICTAWQTFSKQANKQANIHKWEARIFREEAGCGLLWTTGLWSLHNLNVACTKLTIFVACQWIFRCSIITQKPILFRRVSANLNKMAGLVGPNCASPHRFPPFWLYNIVQPLISFRCWAFVANYPPPTKLSALFAFVLCCCNSGCSCCYFYCCCCSCLCCCCCSRPGLQKVLGLRNSFSVWRHKFHG